MTPRRRVLVLAELLATTGVLAAIVLRRVFATIFFAVTVAYMLYPIRKRLVNHGVTGRIAAAASTLLAFLFAAGIIAPIAYALYSRRDVFNQLRNLPQEFLIEGFGTTYTVDLTQYVSRLQDVLGTLALEAARAAPVLALKLFLFVLLVYALLLKPATPARALHRTVPEAYHDILDALHCRLRDTLYGIYVLQGATALGTFVIALGVFWGLRYEPAFTLAVVAGLLQFVPIVGPSILVGALALAEVLAEDVTGAAVIAVVGLVAIAALPDVLIRPRLSEYAADMPGSLYFIGFTGGVLTMGAIGIIAGPVVVALLAEAFDLLASERNGPTATGSADGPGSDPTPPADPGGDPSPAGESGTE